MNRLIRCLLVAMCLSACGHGSTPTSPTLILTDLKLSGPSRVAPGGTTAFSAVATYSDGSTKDVTAQATWTPTDSTLPLYFSSAGTAQSSGRGEVVVSASFGGKTTSSLTVFVLEPGTFRLSGTITNPAGAPVAGVLVEIVAGTGNGLRTTTGSTGHYALYGVSGAVQIRLSADGWQTQTRDAVVANDAVNNFNVNALVPPPPPPVLTDVTLSGPSRVAPGATAAFSATAMYSDGSRKDVTSDSAWKPTDRTLPLFFTGAGAAQSSGRGEVVVSASFGNKTTNSLTVFVLEPGTFRLTGSIKNEIGGQVAGALVEVVSGIGSGLRATTGSTGRYAIYGVAGAVQLRVSADGWQTQMLDTVVANDSVDNFTVSSSLPTSAVGGVWTATLSASPGCRDALPPPARDRTFQVQITQQNSTFRAVLSSPTLQLYDPFESGAVLGDQFTLYFSGDTGYNGFSSVLIVDHLDASTAMGFDGTMIGTVSGNEIHGTMSGDVEFWNNSTAGGPPASVCRAPDHGVVLRRSAPSRLARPAARPADSRALTDLLEDAVAQKRVTSLNRHGPFADEGF